MSATRTVVIVPRDAERLRGQLCALSATGMVNDAILVDEAGAAERVADGECTPVDLDRELGSVSLEMLRLVALRLGATPEAAQYQLEEHLARELRTRADESGIEFTALVIVVVAENQLITRDMFHRTWAANVLIAPQDGGGTKGSMLSPVRPEQLEDVGLSALASLGGLWRWLPGGVLDDDQPIVIEDLTYVRLARVTTRVIDAGDLATAVTDWAMDESSEWPVPDGMIEHGQPGQAVDELAALLAHSPECGFRFSPHETPPGPTPKSLGPWAAIRLFYGRLWSNFSGMPGQALAQVRDQAFRGIERFVQENTFGEDAAVVVRIGQQPRSAAEVSGAVLRIGLLDEMKDVTVPAPLSTVETWRLVRCVAFGAIDGSDFAGSLKGRELEWLAQRAVIADRDLIAPGLDDGDEQGPFVIEPGELECLSISTTERVILRPADVLSATLLQTALRSASPAAVPEAQATTVGASTKSPPPQLPPPAPRASGAAAQASTYGAAEVDAGSDGAASSAAAEPATPTLADLRSRLDSWVVARSRSLTWKLGTYLNDGTSNALADFKSTSLAYEQLKAERAGNERKWEKIRRSFRYAALASVFAVLALTLLALDRAVRGRTHAILRMGARASVLALVGLTVAALIGIPLAWLRTARELTMLEFRLRQLIGLPDRLLARRTHAVHEAARLTYLSEQLLDWADIISCIVHRPWGPARKAGAVEPWKSDLDVQQLVVGVPEIDEEARHSEIYRLRRDHLARPGWLSAVFAETLALWQERYRVATAARSSGGLDPSADASVTRTSSPRRGFRSDVLSAHFASAIRESRVEALRTEVEDRGARLLRVVQCSISGLDGQVPERFLRPVVELDPLSDFGRFITHRVDAPSPDTVRCHLGTSDQFSKRELPPPPRQSVAIHPVPNRFVLAATRVDLSEPLSLIDLAMCDHEADRRWSVPDVDRPGPTPSMLDLDVG